MKKILVAVIVIIVYINIGHFYEYVYDYGKYYHRSIAAYILFPAVPEIANTTPGLKSPFNSETSTINPRFKDISFEEYHNNKSWATVIF
ncbi:MAG: hypothetical protein QMD50_01805 [Patescibacteria group bacterium]|nr:hypothetical protein [Patescibacteria group bacterium]